MNSRSISRDSIGSDSTDVISMKRWLAFLEGGLLPIISLTSLHFFVKYETPQKPDQVPTNNPSSTPQVEEVEMSKPEENLDELDVILDESLDINEEYFQEDVFLPEENTEPENTIKRLTYKRKDE